MEVVISVNGSSHAKLKLQWAIPISTPIVLKIFGQQFVFIRISYFLRHLNVNHIPRAPSKLFPRLIMKKMVVLRGHRRFSMEIRPPPDL